MAEEFISQGQVTGISPAEVVVNYLKAQSGKFVFDGFLNGVTPTMTIQRGSTYRFDLTGASGHALAFSTDSGNSSAYTTNVTTSAGVTELIVAASAPATLYYYCSNHAGMGGTMNVVDAPPSYAGNAGVSYQVDINCTGNAGAAGGTVCPESLATAQASVTINDAAGYGRIEKGNMRWGAILEVLGEQQNPNYVTWPGVGTGNARTSGATGNFDSIRFTVNYPTNWTPTTYLDASGAVTSTLIDAPGTAIKYVIGKVLSNILTHNRSLGSVDPTGDDQKDHDGVIAPAMFASYGAAVGKVTVTSL
jgi:plastocyanin